MLPFIMAQTFQRFLLLALVALNLTGCTRCTSSGSRSHKREVSIAERDQAVKGATDFAFSMYAKLKGDGNFFYSPYSLWEALAMTYAGANADTKTQMAKALNFGTSEPFIHSAIHTLNRTFHESGIDSADFRLSISNALWGQEGHKFLDPFLSTLKDSHDSDLRRVDFKNHTDEARVRINDWAKKATEGQIKEIIPSGILSADTRLVLTNAIYLKGKWKNPFDKTATQPADFQISPGHDPNRCDKPGVCTEIGVISPHYVKADMMQTTAKFRYAETDEYSAVEMPYVGDKFAMLAILPKRPKVDTRVPHEINPLGMVELEQKLSHDYLQRIKGSLKEDEIYLQFPKFTIRTNSNPKNALKEMGMTNAFSDKGDFSLMTGARDLFVSNVLHEAFILVDEEGTEAAAATGVVGAMSAMPGIRFDRPFICLIWDKESGTVLFMGRMFNPRVEE